VAPKNLQAAKDEAPRLLQPRGLILIDLAPGGLRNRGNPG